MLALAEWLQWTVAVALFLVFAVGGIGLVRRIATSQPKERIEPEEVANLDVVLVCAECGTEFQVTRLGEIQIPRHCGEPMDIVRRPRQQPQNN